MVFIVLLLLRESGHRGSEGISLLEVTVLEVLMLVQPWMVQSLFRFIYPIKGSKEEEKEFSICTVYRYQELSLVLFGAVHDPEEGECAEGEANTVVEDGNVRTVMMVPSTSHSAAREAEEVLRLLPEKVGKERGRHDDNDPFTL